MSRLSRLEATAVLSWLTQRHGVAIGRVALCDAGPAGIGVAASSGAAAEDILLAIPRMVWSPFSAATARLTLPPSVPVAVDAQAASLGGGSHFADAVLLAGTIANAEASPEHAPYLSMLPSPDVPLLWPSPLRVALLQGSSAEPAAQQQAVLSNAFHNTLASALAAAAGPPPPTLLAFKRAQALLLSRAHSGAGKPFALVPGLDLLNHGGSRASADVNFDEASGEFRLVARRPHEQGEEVTIDYGSDASHRLLRLYGFLAAEAGDAAAVANSALDEPGAPISGEEVSLSLVPAELADASEASREAWRQHRAALAACGLHGSTMRLRVDATGAVPLALASADSTGDASAADTALLVLSAAIDAQLERQSNGLAASAAVEQAEAAPADFRDRARLARRLHLRERAVLLAAEAETQRRLRSHR